jgi:hypothetical protein
MTMGLPELSTLGAALAVGIAVAAIYCLALRRAVRRVTSARQGLWSRLLTGSLLRTLLTAAALAAVGIGDPRRAAVAVFGFAIGRVVMLRALRDGAGRDEGHRWN